MSWFVITDTGELVHHPEPVDALQINAVMPTGWWQPIRLRVHDDLYAFVDESGHMVGLARNDVGSCVLVELGAMAYAYAGPVVITGWCEPSDSTEIRDLTDTQVAAIVAVHREVRNALAGRDAVGLRLEAAALRSYAEWVAVSPVPLMRVVDFEIAPEVA